MFNIYAFGEVCVELIPIVIFLSIFLTAVLKGFASHSSYGMQVLVVFSYIFCVGVIVHEAAHRLMCKIFGVKVKETQYFKVERRRIQGREYANIGGYVKTEEVSSIITGLFLGVAPLIVNGLLVALLYYYNPVWMETEYYGLLIYLGIALALGARPSKTDLTLMWHAFQKHPGRGLLEIAFLCSFSGVIFFLMLYQFELWITLTVGIVFVALCIIQGRNKLSTPRLCVEGL